MEHNARVAERNRKMTTLFGKVSCDLNQCASRVRVNIPGTDDIPLSVKASLNNYPRVLFKKGVAVEVEQCKHDGRKFRVTQVFEAVRKSVHLQFKITVPDADAFKKEEIVEKVRFYLCSNYFNHPDLHDVLNRTLGITFQEFQRSKRNDRGMTFICTTDQFARFLIERNLNGIKNGFMDLSAKLIRPTPPPNAYDLLAKTAGITHDQAKRVALALCYGSPSEIMERIKTDPHTPRDYACEIDVSDR
jgi:hypothetical protein